MKKRDLIVVPLLKKLPWKINLMSEKRAPEKKERADDKEKAKLKDEEFRKTFPMQRPLFRVKRVSTIKNSRGKKAKSPLVNRGVCLVFGFYVYLQRRLFDPEKCSFVFRNIQDKLYERVEKQSFLLSAKTNHHASDLMETKLIRTTRLVCPLALERLLPVCHKRFVRIGSIQRCLIVIRKISNS